MLSTILSHGGLVLWGIAVASLIGLAVIIERCWRMWPLQAAFRSSWERIRATLIADGVEAACQLVAEPANALERMVGQGLALTGRGRDLVREAAIEAAQREVPDLERRLRIIGTVAQVAPLLGLLGTVVGLIDAFRVASATDSVTSAGLANGIYLALGTTAAGLTVAIPAWIAHNALAALSGRLVDQLEHAAGELPLLVDEAK